jgi:transcription initiation factor TFIID subunit 6
VEHIKTLILKVIPGTIKSIRTPPDNIDEYRQEFGSFFGPLLHAAVLKSRAQAQITIGPGGVTGSMASPSGVSKTVLPAQTKVISLNQHQMSGIRQGNQIFVMKSAPHASDK